MKLFIILWLVCTTCSYAQHFAQEWRSEGLQAELEGVSILATQPMAIHLQSIGRKADFENTVFYVALSGGLYGVFKPCPEDDSKAAKMERAAYHASLKIGFPLIPPTTVHTDPHLGRGSLQLYVEQSLDPLNPAHFSKVNRNSLDELMAFCFVFGQWDAGPHNMLLKEEEGQIYPIAIDNSELGKRQFVERYGERPFVRIVYSDDFKTDDWHAPFPFHTVQEILEPTRQKLYERFGNKLPESFYATFKSYNGPFRYIIYQNGLWRQFGRDKAALLYPKSLSRDTIEAFKRLNEGILREVFESNLLDENLKQILERRDMLVAVVRVAGE